MVFTIYKAVVALVLVYNLLFRSATLCVLLGKARIRDELIPTGEE